MNVFSRSLVFCAAICCGSAGAGNAASAAPILPAGAAPSGPARLVLTYSYSNLLDGGMLDPLGKPLPRALLRGSIEEAMRLWAAHAPIDFVEVPDNGPRHDPLDGGTQGEIRFGYRTLDGPGGVKARAHFPSFDPISRDIHFDVTDRWQEAGTLTYPDILGAAIHELGHVLGLGHSSNPRSNMYGTFPRFQGLGTGTLHPDDIAAIQAIYGPGTGRVTPLALPEPTSGNLAALALFLSLIRPRGTERCPLDDG